MDFFEYEHIVKNLTEILKNKEDGGNSTMGDMSQQTENMMRSMKPKNMMGNVPKMPKFSFPKMPKL